MSHTKHTSLLTRDEFRNKVFARDNHVCVVCKASTKLDAHHVLERRLWSDGGYYIDNGASVCEPCHILAEATLISCETLREKCGVKTPVIPSHLYPDEVWDKWGNLVLPNGMRMKGELFYDESVQKVLQPVLHLFTDRVKYPRTYHFSWSPGATKDDRVLTDLSGFVGEEVVVTVKMDGENTTMYRDGLHARSLTYDPHPSRNRVRALQAALSSDIPEDMRVCGENLFAAHSIHYTELPSHFLMFSMWKQNKCLSWDETVEWAGLLDLQVVPTLYRGPWNERLIKGLFQPTYNGNVCEGYVVRPTREFSYSEFRRVVGKYVRPNHVTTHGHWMRSRLELNGIKE